MEQLITAIDKILAESQPSSFSVYSSVETQELLNVPFTKPTLICVLDGRKEVGQDPKVTCTAGNFIVFGDGFGVDMRNIPSNDTYFAVLIEFEKQDFADFHSSHSKKARLFVGSIEQTLQLALQQFVEWTCVTPQSLWHLRRRELLHLLVQLGYTQITSMASAPGLTQQIHDIIRRHLPDDITVESVGKSLGMSESTLRRKLNSEGTHFQTLKNDIVLGKGLHLLQSTDKPINFIAMECGYQSQSRFTERFKQKFGLTPSELRKTRMTE